jgi:hypothetical protein
MTTAKAQQIGFLLVLVFTILTVAYPLYWIYTEVEDILFDDFKYYLTFRFFDLYIPLLVIFSFILGRKLGVQILIRREKKIWYHTARVIFMVSVLSIFITIAIYRMYYSIIDFTDDALLKIFKLLGILLFQLFSMVIESLPLYLALLLPCGIAGLFCSFIFKQIRNQTL